MDLLHVASGAASAVIALMNGTLARALEEVGSQIVKLLQERFKSTLNIEQAKEKPKLLEATIITEGYQDPEFKETLEKLVNRFQDILNRQEPVVQNASDGSVNINAANNQGNVTGIDQRTFR